MTTFKYYLRDTLENQVYCLTTLLGNMNFPLVEIGVVPQLLEHEFHGYGEKLVRRRLKNGLQRDLTYLKTCRETPLSAVIPISMCLDLLDETKEEE